MLISRVISMSTLPAVVTVEDPELIKARHLGMEGTAQNPLLRTPVLGPRPDYSGALTDRILVEVWLDTSRSAATRRAYASDARGFLAWMATRPRVDIGEGFSRARQLHELTVFDFSHWTAALTQKCSKRGYMAAATAARKIHSMKALFSFGVATGYLPFNVSLLLRAPRVSDALAERILTVAEVRAIIDAATPAVAELCRFLYATGARISEALALRHEHISEGVATLQGKGGKARHVRVDRLPAETGSPWVFPATRGGKQDAAHAARGVRAAAVKAGLAQLVTPHWFRHAHASHALDASCPIHLLQRDLGHASLATTGRYAHARPQDSSGSFLTVI